MTVFAAALVTIITLIALVAGSSTAKIISELDISASILNNPNVIAMYDVILPIGISLVVLYWMMELVEQTTHDNFTPEHFVKSMIKLILGVIILTNLMDILLGISAFSAGLCNNLLDSLSSNATEVIVPDFASKSWFTMVGETLSCLVSWLPNFIINLSAYLTSISRNLYIAIMAVFAPIGVANIFGKGMDSPGMSYLKKFLALCLQYAIIVAIIMIYHALTADVVSNIGGIMGSENDISFWTEGLMSFAAASLLFKSKQMAETIVGVR